MQAEYVSSTSFSIQGNKIDEFVKLRRVRLDCGEDGLLYETVLGSQFDDPNTIVTVEGAVITPNLKSVQYSIVKPGDEGNEPDDWDHGTELPETGKGGDLFFKTNDGHIYIYND